MVVNKIVGEEKCGKKEEKQKHKEGWSKG